jgi:hypothetical protein
LSHRLSFSDICSVRCGFRRGCMEVAQAHKDSLGSSSRLPLIALCKYKTALVAASMALGISNHRDMFSSGAPVCPDVLRALHCEAPHSCTFVDTSIVPAGLHRRTAPTGPTRSLRNEPWKAMPCDVVRQNVKDWLAATSRSCKRSLRGRSHWI